MNFIVCQIFTRDYPYDRTSCCVPLREIQSFTTVQKQTEDDISILRREGFEAAGIDENNRILYRRKR